MFSKIVWQLSRVAALLLSSMNAFSQTPRPVPPAYRPEVKVNYVRTWEALAPIADPNQLHTATPVNQARLATQYLDGLGRPLQLVIKGGSLATGGTPMDMVAPVEYDAFDREVFRYLPYAAPEGNGLFKTNPFQQQQSFFSEGNPLNPLKGQGETVLYGETRFEPSPLGRVEKTLAPGNSWTGSNKGVESNYWSNRVEDSVRLWDVTPVTTGLSTYTTPRTYPAGELYKTVVVDEHGKQIIEFTDKEGKVVLKKVQLTATPDAGTGSGHRGWLCTYYLYDDLGLLQCVIQPKGVELLQANGWNITALNGNILAEQCFRYAYDERGRMVIKKVPGAAEVHLVYDARNRLVLTQDGNLRGQSKWIITLYDELNRPIQAGVWTNNNDRAYHKAQAYNSTAYPFSSTTVPSTGWELLSETHYDNYNGLPAELSSALVNSGYSSHFLSSYNVAPDYAQEVKTSIATRGMITWTKTRILGTNEYITSVNLYDEKGRLIQVQSINQTGGLDIATTQYAFNGQVLRTHIKHQKAGTTPFTIDLATKNSYDLLGRLSKVEKNLNNTGWKAINELEYDALGQLKTKKLGTGALETLAYEYNIRGWILGMNRDYVKDASSNYFGYELGYDKPTTLISGASYAQPQYNGNIAGTLWKSKGDGEKRKYDFSYDAANRLLSADFNQHSGGSFNKTAGVDFSVKLGNGIHPDSAYDGNGNILSLQQKGLKLNTSPVIDQLSYSYIDNSNKLKGVSDAANDNSSKLGDFKYEAATKGSIDYGYDGNGNLISDANKKITSIVYNHLNLPQTITVQGKGTIQYTYDAAGNKLKKVTTDNTVSPAKITTTLYLMGGVYENDSLQFIAHEEGRIRYQPAMGSSPASYQWDYFIKDHLGNIRAVLTEENKTDAYPVASMETAPATTEEALYSNIPQTRVDKPSDYPADTYTTPNDKVAKVRGDGQKIGPAITLKVMAGDKINIRVNSWYKLNSISPSSPVSPLNDLLAALSSGIGSLSGKVTATELSSSGVLTPNAIAFLNTQNSYTTTKPKAFLNWLLLDEQFKYVSSSSGFEQVGADGELKTHTLSNLPISKSGYLYVYVSNETPNIDVFFDNLQVSHVRGALLEENHYYPYGLAMHHISTKAIGSLENKRKYQQYELNSAFDINLYESFFRSHDPQLGRFWQTDPKPNEFISLYSAMGNNPISNMDILGDTLRGVNATSAERTLALIQGAFSGIKNSSALVKLFSIGSDGVSFNNIDAQAFNDAYSQLGSDEAKAMATGFYSMVNSNETHFSAVLNLQNNETLDLSSAKGMSDDARKAFAALGFKDGMSAMNATNGGGGQSAYLKNHNASLLTIAMDPIKEIPAIITGKGGKSFLKNYVPSASFIFTHEALGHNLSGSAFKNIPNFLDRSWANNSASVQVNNIYYRAHGMNYYDNGSGHMPLKDGQRQSMPRQYTIGIPSYLKFIR